VELGSEALSIRERETAMQFGHFSPDGAEYVITHFPTPRPWENYLSNREYGLRVGETGAGYSVLPVAPGCRITYASPGEPFSKLFYLRDHDSGRHWSLTWQPVGAPYDSFQCRHGLDYTIFEMAKDGVETALRVFIPLQDPVEIWTATIRSTGTGPRRLTLFPYLEWHLAPYTRPWDNYRNYIAAQWSPEERLIVATLNDPAHPGQAFVGFAGVDPPAAGFDCEREPFIGSGSLASPAAVVAGKCSNRNMPGDGRAIAVFQIEFELGPGDETAVTLLAGLSADPAHRQALLARYLGADKAQAAFAQLRSHWRELEQQPCINTPDPRLDRMANLWLKDNIKQLAYVIREGTRGYRDTLQDAMGIVSFDPVTARQRIVEALAYQYPDGHALRQFTYNGGPHDLRVYNDSPLWLVLATARYLKETGEFGLLDESVPFFDGPEQACVFDHLTRAVDWLDQRRGHHDLIRIDRGDWCDALDEVGREGKGVSVWLSQAFHLTLLELAGIAALRGDDGLAARCRRRAAQLCDALEQHAWDGDWYICAISDRGRRLGVKSDRAMEIYLNTQSWAAIGQTGSPERVARALDSADRKLDSPLGPLLLHPPFYEYDPDVGRLTVLRPGCGENGTVYVHAAVFYFLANLIAHRPERALDILARIAPMMEQQDPRVTLAAPYSYVNSYVGLCYPAHAGRSLANWYTSSASWTLVAITDWLLGVRPTYDGLLIAPCLPRDWERASLRRNWRGATYNITITKPRGLPGRTVALTVDGEELGSNLIPHHADGRTHSVTAELQP
jgi:cellobiose phosphorylase